MPSGDPRIAENSVKGVRKGGRQKGTPNKITAEHRAWIDGLLGEQREKFKANMAALEPKDHCRVYSDLLEFAIPKLARTELISEDSGINIHINDARARPTE